MNLLRKIFNRRKSKKSTKQIQFIMTERLIPWIVIKCLEKENYLITEKQAHSIATIIIKQSIKLKVFNKVLNGIN